MGIFAELHPQPRIQQARRKGQIRLQTEVKHRVKIAREVETGTTQHHDTGFRHGAVIFRLQRIVILGIHKAVNLEIIAELPHPLLLHFPRQRIRLRKSVRRRKKKQDQDKKQAKSRKIKLIRLCYISHNQYYKGTKINQI